MTEKEEKLNAILTTIATCYKCPLSGTRNKTVPGEGNSSADIVIIGEGPGEENDKTGRPFVGRGGQLLDNFLQESGLKRSELFLTNIIKCRMPHNATPSPNIIKSCDDYLYQQLATIQPKIIITLGLPAARVILNDKKIKLSDLNDRVFEHLKYKVLCTYHPSSIRYNKEAKAKIIQTLMTAKKLCDRGR